MNCPELPEEQIAIKCSKLKQHQNPNSKNPTKSPENLYNRLVLIAGKSGSGKTSVINNMAGMYGKVAININLCLSKKMLDFIESEFKAQAIELYENFELEMLNPELRRNAVGRWYEPYPKKSRITDSRKIPSCLCGTIRL